MRSNNETPLSKEDQFAANLAMAARKETDAFKKTLSESIQLKMWCIEKAIEAAKITDAPGFSIQIAESYYKFITE